MLYAILHNIRSLYNVGSMFRTADGAGVEKIFLTGYSGRPPRKEITKTALGAEKIVSWEYRRTPVEVIRELKKRGFTIVALEQAKGSVVYRNFILTTPRPSLKRRGSIGRSLPLFKGEMEGVHDLVLLVGNEVRGISSSLLKHADHIIHIPMRGKKESLNVSVAFGIAVYHISTEALCMLTPCVNTR